MTTPAGWYDDGSGRHRWWDGEQWTEHFAPDTEPHLEGGTAAEPVASETGSDATSTSGESEWSAAWAEAASSTETPAPVEEPQLDAPAHVEPPAQESGPSADAPAPETPAVPEAPHEAAIAPAATPDWSTPPAPPAAQDWSTPPAPPAAQDWSTPPAPPIAPSDTATPGYAAPGGYPGTSPAPSYAPAAPGYATPGYATPGYAGAYPVPGYASAPVEPASISVLGLVGAGAATLGVVFAFIPVLWVISWFLLGGGLIVSVVSLFLKGRKWPGITGIIVAVVGFILAVVMGIVFFITGVASTIDSLPSSTYGSDSDSESTSPTDGGVMTPVIDLALGDCLPTDYDEGAYEVPVVPCDQPHAEEVYLLYEIEGDEYPGEDVVLAQADEVCAAEFETFIGIPYADSEYYYFPYYPTLGTWTSQNDRIITCIVFSYDEVTGTLEGSRK